MKKTLLLLFLLGSILTSVHAQKSIFISPNGHDTATGTKEQPVQSFQTAFSLARQSQEKTIEILIREGTYYLGSPVIISSGDFPDKKICIAAYMDEKVIVSGGQQLKLNWKKNKNNLYEASVDVEFDQLFVNGDRRIMARYPNYEDNTIFNGTSEDALSTKRIKSWKNPEGGFIHAMHSGQWGSQHYTITGKGKDTVSYHGGFQNNRLSRMHPSLRFVENIREELDAPGEWFLDKQQKKLYYYPLPTENMDEVRIEVAGIPHLFELRGTEQNPLCDISFRRLVFTHTKRTFMDRYEPLMRSDWGIYRGAAVVFENTRDCELSDCEFRDLGGNAVFISRYNLNTVIKSNHFHRLGASAVCIVGDTSAVRSGSFEYKEFIPYEQLDQTPGPDNSRYPRQCTIEDNLIHDIGQVEKQVAGVQIQIASEIIVRHNTIYRVPRSAINVGDGSFGGHVIEYNDAFETVLETSDHGAFNSWGRDRFWHPHSSAMKEMVKEHPGLILLDAIYTTIIRNNRFRCDHGWDIDLDDGSSNYHIYNNVCLRGGIKLREGFYRTVENNILINNSLHPHVWFENSEDIVQRNLFMQPYYPISLNGWGKQLDYNFFISSNALENVRKNGTDKHSISGTAPFADARSGNYTVQPGADIFKIGFENIPMDRFGVYTPSLKALAEKPEFPTIVAVQTYDDKQEYDWLGIQVKAVSGLGERSAFGLPDEKGIIIGDISAGSKIKSSELRKNDVIRAVNGKPIDSVGQLFELTEQNRWKGGMKITIFRNQEEREIGISFR